jgi:ParB-like chromosome segregation protein Spo0J
MLKNTLKPIINGFKLLASEGKWIFIKGFRIWEIRQMEKRLAEELQNLGKNYADSQAKGEAFDPKVGDNDLTLKQISFLQEEINHLEQELSSTRAKYVKSRSEESNSGV